MYQVALNDPNLKLQLFKTSQHSVFFEMKEVEAQLWVFPYSSFIWTQLKISLRPTTFEKRKPTIQRLYDSE